ncbi:60S ribosomal protein L3, partial [Pseudoloma neurophilia]
MSCRKFEAPRHGSLAYCPKKRASSIKQREPAVPKDNVSDKPHLTSFLSYKVGMTHILRISSRKTNEKKKEVRKEVVDAVTLLEAPPMKIFGIRCYTKGINGLLLKDEILSKNL